MADEDFDEAEAAAFLNLKTSLVECAREQNRKLDEILRMLEQLSNGPISTGRVTRIDLIAENELSDPFAHQVLEEMPKSLDRTQSVAKDPSDFGAHKVFDETPTSVDDSEEVSKVTKEESLQTIVQEKIEAAPIEAHRSHKTDEDPKELHILFGLPKVISCVSSPLEATTLEVALEEIMASDDILVDSMEIKIAYNLFDEMSTGVFSNLARWVQLGLVDHSCFVGSVDTFRILGDNGINLVFDPGGIDLGLLSRNEGEGINVSKAQILWNAHEVFEEMSSKEIVLFGSYFELRSIDTREFFEFSALAPNLRGGTVIFKPNTSNRVSNLYPYDRGKVALHYEGCNMFQMEPNLISQGVALLPDIAAAVAKHRVLDRKVVFDPGIASFGSEQSRTKSTLSTHVTWKVPAEYGIEVATNKVLVFDPGGNYPIVMNRNENVCAESCVVESIESYSVLHCIRIFDPSGGCYKSVCAAEMSDFCQVAVQLMVE